MPADTTKWSDLDQQVYQAVLLRETFGHSWRQAAQEVGCDSPQKLRSAAITRGYSPEKVESHREKFALIWAEIGEEAALQQREKLLSGEELKASELNFIAGTATDKVAVAEKWNRDEGTGSEAFLKQLAASLKKLGPEASVTVKLETGPETIDVTPEHED